MRSCKNCNWNISKLNECELGFECVNFCTSHDYCEGIIDVNIMFYDNKYFMINESSSGTMNFMYIYRTHIDGIINYYLVGCGNETSIKIEIPRSDKLYNLFKKLNYMLGKDNKIKIQYNEDKCIITFMGKKMSSINAVSVDLGNYKNCKNYFDIDEIYAYLDDEIFFNSELCINEKQSKVKSLLKEIKR